MRLKSRSAEWRLRSFVTIAVAVVRATAAVFQVTVAVFPDVAGMFRVAVGVFPVAVESGRRNW